MTTNIYNNYIDLSVNKTDRKISGNLAHVTGNNTINMNQNTPNLDPDEQFVLDIIRSTKQESIQNLTDLLRLQESKSILLIRILERYKEQLENKELLK